MKIAAITKFKHGALFELLKELGWTQREFARRCNVSVNTMGHILNLRKRPNEQYITKMEIAFGRVGKYVDVAEMFPSSYIGFKRPLCIVQVQDVKPEQLEWFRQTQLQLLQDAQPPIPSDAIDTKEKLELIANILDGTVKSKLTQRERSLIQGHLIDGRTLRKLGAKYGVSAQAMRIQLNKALGKIRNYFYKHDSPDSLTNVAARIDTSILSKVGRNPEFRRLLARFEAIERALGAIKVSYEKTNLN